MARDIAEIRRDIAQSRERLRQTAEAIGYKADVPSRAMDLVREARSVLQSRNPGGASSGADGGGPAVGDAIHAVQERIGGAASAVAGKVSAAKETVAERASSAKGTVAERASSAKETTSGGLSSATEVVPSPSDLAHGARGVARTAASNPMPLALGGLALGIAGALLLPTTRIEKERVAPVADDLAQRGADMGVEAIEQGRQTVTGAVGG